MPHQLKAAVENLSGVPLDNVRVHYNSAKPAQLQALAYTQGTDIYIGPGQERQVAHEAWHVVQQAEGRVQATRQMKGKIPLNDDPRLEREADEMGARLQTTDAAAVANQPSPAQPHSTPASSAVVQRSVKSVTINTSNIVSNVVLDNSRVGVHTGDQHTTSYTLMESMVRNNILGKKLDDAFETLAVLVEQNMFLPTYQTTTWKEDPNTAIARVAGEIRALKGGNGDVNDLLKYANETIAYRNSLDRSSYKNKNPTHSGVNEGNEAGILDKIELELRNGNKAFAYKPDIDVFPHVWNLFHFDPQSQTSEEELAAQIIQHAYTIMLAYPNIPELSSPVATIANGLKTGDIALRVVDSKNYDWKKLATLLNNYGTKKHIPQYLKKARNDYDKIIGKYGYSLV
ncbi:DUF4157 domain-containing protein [Methylogaea oryzae]|uniref:eCIS core domain-containing protein n=1 Tax=Methylogaea oryzae TaxID=1295382 RepID=UPI000AF2FA30|nr:DUF4157 domain-containing protein [Methylogaea oryzae]